jgi:hypothetical protein
VNTRLSVILSKAKDLLFPDAKQILRLRLRMTGGASIDLLAFVIQQ